jgi:hypothetical protein
MTGKKKSEKKEPDLENELEGLIKQNEHQARGMKKLIDSIESQKDKTTKTEEK